MPAAHFYARNHFPTPTLDPELYELTITGLVERPLSLRLRDLQNMPSHSLVSTLECAGDDRVHFGPPVDGEPWRFAAATAAEWRDRKDKSYQLGELDRPTVRNLTTPTRRIPAPGPQQVRSTRCAMKRRK
ncbi:MAG: molybdopterin-dependent oxidoreductase [Mycobacterium sp.]|nr:molybdopterin-dependent oxidoreductase [Mycobacterium sp.]